MEAGKEAQRTITDICRNCGGPIVHSSGPWWRHANQVDAATCRIPTLSGLDSIEFALPTESPIVPAEEA